MANGSANQRRLAVLIVATFVAFGAAAPRASAQALTSAQGDAILSELKEMRRMLENMQKQLAALGAAQRAPAADAPVKVAIATGQSMGSANAPLVLIEFTDYQCPYCRNFAVSTFPALKTKYIDTGKVQFVTRDFPLDFHPNAMIAANAARCAADQGKYWEIRSILFTNNTALQKDRLLGYARDLSLNMPKFQQCLDQEIHGASIQADLSDALAAGVEGTPTFVLGRRTPTGTIEGVRIVGAQPLAVFDAKIGELLGAK